MAKRSDIVTEARKWIGTPYRYGGRHLGVGCDCAAPVAMIPVALGLPAADLQGYNPQVTAAEITAALESFMDRIDPSEAKPGDVLQIELDGPRHLAVLTDRGILHSNKAFGKVTEHRMDRFWRRQIRAAWRYRGVEED